eukprot:CAMPEP_0178738480 /NCGR_PEP_ID=MMETSP0744-20121128/3536_1 /TAXON_ID=913974 /ORGANISM="Nitzschia punctata, Strain CCMP561" /LENGTH=798 /DNA_ID=CAMNT_0020391103 /DNA_START=13 /DNA_END=2410 /DNA_ORIENTATION=+
MSCTSQQGAADSCITSDAACADCPEFADGGMEGFMKGVEGAFKKTQAFVMTTDPAFCDVAQDHVNQELEAKYNCCCNAELQDYVKCNFDQELAMSFGLVGCTYSAAGDAEGGEGGDGGFPMMIVIIAVVAVVLLCCCCCCGCYCYRRRRRNNQEKEQGETDEEKGGDEKTSAVTQKTGATCDWSTANDDVAADKQERGLVAVPQSVDNNKAFFGFDNDDDDDDDEKYFKRSSSRRSLRGDGRNKKEGKKMKRSSSRRSLHDGSDTSDDDSRTRRSNRSYRSKNSRKFRKSSSKKSLRHRNSDSDDSSISSCSSSASGSRRSKRSSKSRRKKDKKGNRSSRRQSVEESMRHARSILENSQDANGKLQQTEMTELLAQLKLQKEEMEAKLKTVEEEKSKLKLEMESNQREADKKVANAELDVVKKEKEEMAQLIKKLETAKIEMEERLQAARNETEILKEEHQDTLNRVEKVESEKEQLRAKLATVEMSRDDIHMRLMEAEGRSQQLKEAKRAKTLEIRELREKPGVSTPMVEESERQRRTISKNLKRVEEEKAQFRAMMAKMDMIEESTSSAVSSLSPLNSIPVVANQGARQSLAECVSNGSTRLMDFENDEAMQSHPPNRKFIRSSSTSRLLDNKNNSNDTRKMMHNLEQDIMSSQIHNCQMYTQDEVSVISCPLNYIQATVDRPAGWLGDQISNRSYTNLTALEQTPEKNNMVVPQVVAAEATGALEVEVEVVAAEAIGAPEVEVVAKAGPEMEQAVASWTENGNVPASVKRNYGKSYAIAGPLPDVLWIASAVPKL